MGSFEPPPPWPFTHCLLSDPTVAGVLDQGQQWLQPECLGWGVGGGAKLPCATVKEERLISSGAEEADGWTEMLRYSEVESPRCTVKHMWHGCTHKSVRRSMPHPPPYTPPLSTHTRRTARVSAGMTDAVRAVVCSAGRERPEGLCYLTVHQGSAVTPTSPPTYPPSTVTHNAVLIPQRVHACACHVRHTRGHAFAVLTHLHLV